MGSGFSGRGPGTGGYKKPGTITLGLSWLIYTWTLKVCRIIAFYRYWASILVTFEGLGKYPTAQRSNELALSFLRGLGVED